ncbi:helix-turn-helix domain-containing protein [Lactiplantibacillus songbeiensis]|uniref:Helix-turn-helix domain-containing protein n=1 Tax=Lactiplantibacillus songbeiensis TaxID=2559920 RepID=A0ABW4BVW9_9LACO|nr:helix-turn-helix transcriptional regulator [Lactiplantibacillus songbeiensis]
MLANRLSVLLAERQLTIKQVVDETKISRNTISNITNNINANISTETIDTLCRYLEVTPSDFFSFSPYKFRLGFAESYDDEKMILFDVSKGRTEQMYQLQLVFIVDSRWFDESAPLDTFDLYVDIEEENSKDNELIGIFNELPVVFKNEVTNTILTKISDALQKYTYITRDADFNNQQKRKSVNDYLLSLKPNEVSVLVRLPWGDYSKKLDTKKLAFIK